MYQKRLKKERRARKRLQEQLDLEIKRRTQLEEALKATGASSEQVRAITGKYRFRSENGAGKEATSRTCLCSPIIEISRYPRGNGEREEEEEEEGEKSEREREILSRFFLSPSSSSSSCSVIQDFRGDSSKAEPP